MMIWWWWWFCFVEVVIGGFEKKKHNEIFMLFWSCHKIILPGKYTRWEGEQKVSDWKFQSNCCSLKSYFMMVSLNSDKKMKFKSLKCHALWRSNECLYFFFHLTFNEQRDMLNSNAYWNSLIYIFPVHCRNRLLLPTVRTGGGDGGNDNSRAIIITIQ